MASQVAQCGATVLPVLEPAVREVSTRPVEERNVEIQVTCEGSAKKSILDQLAKHTVSGKPFGKCIDAPHQSTAAPRLHQPARGFEALGEWDAVVHVLAGAQGRQHHVASPIRAGTAIDDVDIRVTGHRAVVPERTLDVILACRLLGSLAARSADADYLDVLERAPSREMGIGAPRRADQPYPQLARAHLSPP